MIRYKHGMRYKPEYIVWQRMRSRCNSKTNKDYKHYGGRGISIDPSWDNFANFYADMGPRPTSKHELDRINNDGNYSKQNCRWATRQQQCINKRVLISKSSKFRYVSFHKATNKWHSAVKRKQVNYYLGVYDTQELAHEAALMFLGSST